LCFKKVDPAALSPEGKAAFCERLNKFQIDIKECVKTLKIDKDLHECAEAVFDNDNVTGSNEAAVGGTKRNHEAVDNQEDDQELDDSKLSKKGLFLKSHLLQGFLFRY
jgi:hypothetical protein